MSYTLAGTRSGVTYYKRNGKYYTKSMQAKQTNNGIIQIPIYIEVHDCFWNKGKVTVIRNNCKYLTSVDQVRVGDAVLTNSGFQTVIHVHLPAFNMSEILKLETSSGEIIGVTKWHLIYDGSGKMKTAEEYQIGDYLQTATSIAKIIKISKHTAKVCCVI